MISNSFFIAALMVTAGFLYLMIDLVFLTPFRVLILHEYLAPLGWFALALFVNIAAAAYAVQRKFGLKDTGRKLQHVERQLRTSSTISADLSGRLSKLP